MFATSAVGLVMAGAVLAPKPATATVAIFTSSHGLQTQPSRSLLDTNDDSDEGNEGNEGLDQFTLANQGGSGGEGNEGNEGDEGAAGILGSGFVPHTPSCRRRPVLCNAIGQPGPSADLQSAAANAHATAVSAIFAELCSPDVATVTAKGAARAASDAAVLFADTVPDLVAPCDPRDGADFSCEQATRIAEAWAASAAESHAITVATAAEDCPCLSNTLDPSVADVSTFVAVVAGVFARAEAEVAACGGPQCDVPRAEYVSCAAAAYVAAWTKEIVELFVESGCYPAEAATRLQAEIGGGFGGIEGCNREDFCVKAAFGSEPCA